MRIIRLLTCYITLKSSSRSVHFGEKTDSYAPEIPSRSDIVLPVSLIGENAQALVYGLRLLKDMAAVLILVAGNNLCHFVTFAREAVR